MDVTSIEKFLDSKSANPKVVNVHFKDRSTITGVFVELRDYDELKAKNFWRVVNVKNLEQWEKRKDVELSRLFNGASFTRLSAPTK
ncbi:short-chain dehydrogenase [Niabella insulamsoli]|uniref:short-chain dehydrogenase n=1 Tax=Niabella insulamsoli TaxID=3144874 RepID=UPI0031FE0C4B